MKPSMRRKHLAASGTTNRRVFLRPRRSMKLCSCPRTSARVNNSDLGKPRTLCSKEFRRAERTIDGGNAISTNGKLFGDVMDMIRKVQKTPSPFGRGLG